MNFKNLINFLCCCFIVVFSFPSYAQEQSRLTNQIGKGKDVCQFIYDHYPDTKFCLPIHNNLNATLHIEKEDGSTEDLSPHLTYIIFKPVKIEKMTFRFSVDSIKKIITMDGKTDIGIECFKCKDHGLDSFCCRDWINN